MIIILSLRVIYLISELYSLAEKIKSLRDAAGITQTELAKMLDITRSAVNSWEMGISIPQTQYIVELARIFGVSTDYLLGVEETATISVKGLSERQVKALCEIINCFNLKNKQD